MGSATPRIEVRLSRFSVNSPFDLGRTSVRDAMVLRLVCQRSQGQIAEQLGYHPSTIRAVVSGLETISGCRDVGEFSRWWYEPGRVWLRRLLDATGLWYSNGVTLTC
jgi:hypothetical protein